MGSHLQHAARTDVDIFRVPTEARVEESGVMHTEFADQRIVGYHFSGVIGRHGHCFPGRKNIKIVRV